MKQITRLILSVVCTALAVGSAFALAWMLNMI